ncbi:NAD(P)-binding protein [Tricholoma matsutake]|nr:NAD(P)-binding protein [Tricholoma matsutake 945]
MINPEGKIHSRLALEHLTRVKPEGSDGERGVVIMVASEVAYGGRMAQVAYAASKGAVCSMTLPLARDLARHNIRVVTISPATFTTPLTDTFSKRVHKGLLDTGVLFPRRYGTPEEFAGTVKWVLDCPYVNGEVIRLTGGGRIPTRL